MIKNFYQIFGYDILFDENFKVWIMETNSFPDFRAQNLRKRILKGAVTIDALNIVGLNNVEHMVIIVNIMMMFINMIILLKKMLIMLFVN